MLSGPNENVLFSLIVQLNASVRQKTTVSFLFQIIHVAELLAIFLVLTNPKDQLVAKVLQSFELFLGLTIFTGLLVVQIAIALKFKFHLQLYNQLKLFRFSIYPLLALILASEITNPYHLPELVPVVLLPSLLSVTYMNCWLNFHQFSYQKVVFSSTEYSKYLVFTDTVMVLALPAQKSIWIYLISFLWLSVSIRIHFKMKNHVKRNLNDKTTAFIAALKNYLLVCLITREVVFETYSYQTIILLTSPTILILFLYELLINLKRTFNADIFNGTASLSEFYRFIYLISSQLHELKTNMNINFQTSLLMLFIALHNEKCKNSKCILLQSSTRDELLTCNESSNRKILLQKVIKKIETLFELYEERYSMDKGLKLIKMQFFTVHILNKIKIKHSIAIIDQSQLDIKERLVVFYSNEKANELQSAEILEDSDADDEFQLFRKKFKEYLILLREFWSILLEEKVDVTSLVRISSKLFPLKRQIETAWIKNLQNQTFATWNIMKTYAFYCRIILRDMTKACILQDYSKIIAYRLKNKQQLSYMNFESQAGVVVISLTESSLGNISGVNMLATNIFNYYNRGQMLSLRVNDIMPDVFSVVHDNILKTYLKNRYKKINQDERSVLGKNKNGYIFPIYLQLRKLSWNTNDQLIFISNVKAIKLRAAPIYCIVDNEGDIHDVSSAFAWLFYKSNTNQAPKAQNIQRLIPSFFDVIEAAQALKQTKFHFDERCSVKKNNSLFEVEFTATQLIIKVDKVGYLLEGKAVDSLDTVQQKKKIGELFIQNAQYKSRFNPRTLCYEITGKTQIASDMKIDDFTIPFMRTVDIQKIFKCEDVQQRALKTYGKDIRTFRLVNNRLELAVEEESFQSQDNDESWRQLTVIKKIQKMKEDMDLEKNKNVTAIFRVLILIMGLCLVAFSVINLIKLLAFETASVNHKNEEVSQWKVRSLLPEILIRSYFPVSLQDENKLTQLRTEFLVAINKTKMLEWKKQSMIKLMNEARTKENISFQHSVFELGRQHDSIQASYVSLLIFQYILIGLLFIFGLGLCYIFYYFQHTIHDIYSIFLSVADQKLRNILDASQRLIDNITYSTNRMIEKVQAEENKKKDEEYQEQDQLIIKKFKRNSEFHNLHIAYTIVLPIVASLLFGIGCTIFINLRVNSFRTNYSIWEKGMEILPQASLKASQQLFKYLNMSGDFDQTTNFQLIQQEYESQIFGSSLISSELVHILKGDPCHQSDYFTNLPADLRAVCENSNFEADKSLSNNLNLIAISLSQITNKSESDWIQIIKIQFELIKPLLEYTMTQIDHILSNDLDQLVKIGAILQILMICIIALTMIYLIWYPIKTMNERIMFTKDLMNIIPSDNYKKPKETLATLTTEAIEFKEYYD